MKHDIKTKYYGIRQQTQTHLIKANNHKIIKLPKYEIYYTLSVCIIPQDHM